MTLLRQLIDIPGQLHTGDFALELVEGVRDGSETLRERVVIQRLFHQFDCGR